MTTSEISWTAVSPRSSRRARTRAGRTLRGHAGLGLLSSEPACLVKVRGTIDGHPFRSSLMANGRRHDSSPVKAPPQASQEAGGPVVVRLEDRIALGIRHRGHAVVIPATGWLDALL